MGCFNLDLSIEITVTELCHQLFS